MKFRRGDYVEMYSKLFQTSWHGIINQFEFCRDQMDYYSVDFYDIDENNFGYSSYGAEIRAEDRLELLSRGFRD